MPSLMCFGEGWGPEWPQGSGKRDPHSIPDVRTCGVWYDPPNRILLRALPSVGVSRLSVSLLLANLATN
jgi:hypothetical protein